MSALILKPITDGNLKYMCDICTASFETQRKKVSKKLLSENMGNELEEMIKEPEVESWAFYDGGSLIGGAVIRKNHDASGSLELFFISADKMGAGYGTKAWFALENKYPEIKLWKTVTPYNVKGNVAFYVKHCGFRITKIKTNDVPEPICEFEKQL
ncbi:MAG: GNAT family N-acetyltransferase [Clostridia bacterium]|nr:GNAT family N-acetyltransferase [Clostridia bacterium]